jgi:ribosomal protein S18 acetylase RimI-like enzyme
LSLGKDKLENILIRSATPKDVDEIRRLVLGHGTTQWSSFPREDLEKHLIKIATGTDHALLAFDGSMLVGMVSFTIGSFYSEYESVTARQEPTGYIVEILVHSGFTRRGIGTQLLERAKTVLLESGVSNIYAKRHEENRASETLMRKTGFQLIDVFSDPRRTSGSCRTAVERFSVKS